MLVSFSAGLPTFVRSILQTSLARRVALQLLRTEVTLLTIRRAWYNASVIPEEVLANYRYVAQLDGWGDALLEMATIEQQPFDIAHVFSLMQCPGKYTLLFCISLYN